MYNFLVWFKIFLIFLITVKADYGPTVEISNGKIRGKILRSLKNNEYYAFEGIPYAAPPVGDNRFMVPSEPKNWGGILETTSSNKKCKQITGLVSEGTEDCLYLHVYTPTNPSLENGTLPVLIYVHSGSFQRGYAKELNPGYLMDYGILVVSINYRLGVFGFLTTSDGVIPGNLGLKDQRFALQWVSKNIRKFGGDPSKVTFSGESAGAVSVSYHLLNRQNKGLFSAAIMQSGSSLCHHDFQPNPRKFAFLLGKIINPFFNGNSTQLLNMLKNVTAEELIKAAQIVTVKNLSIINPIQLIFLTNVWLPVIESTKQSNALITRPMHQSFIDGNFLKIPMMLGFTSEEAVFFPDLFAKLLRAIQGDQNPEFLINEKLNVNDTFSAGRELKAAYTDSFTKHPGAFIQYFSDNYYRIPVLRQADLLFKHIPLFLYQFSYSDARNFVPKIQGAENVGHQSELKFISGNSHFFNKNDKNIHKWMMRLWTNFIKYQFNDGNFLKIPMMLGFTSEEAVFFPDLFAKLLRAIQGDQNPEFLINEKLNVNDTFSAGRELKAAYTDSFTKHPGAFIQYFSDNYYRIPVLRQADLLFKHIPLFLYQFSYSDARNFVPKIQGAENVGHQSELKFISGNSHFFNKNDKNIHKWMMRLWTNFIKYHDPTPTKDDVLINWPRMTADFDCYNINETLSIIQHPRRYNDWKTILQKYLQKPYNVF